MTEPRGRTPSTGRDASWLVSADLLAVALAFIGQIILTHALLAEHYGWMVLAIDLYASLFLVVDLGLPTLLARDGTRAPSLVPAAVWRTYRLQAVAVLPFIVVAVLLRPESWLDVQAPVELLLAASLIALVHVASYAPRSGLRVLGEARLEALTKVVERGLTVVLYGLLAWQGSTSATAFTCAFLLGALAGWLLALYWVVKTAPATPSDVGWDALGSSWTSTAQLVLSALPFAITLGILPYVVRIEKFMVAASGGAELGAVFHVAQLAWLAGLVVPAAVRAALLPVLGSLRWPSCRDGVCPTRFPRGLFGRDLRGVRHRCVYRFAGGMGHDPSRHAHLHGADGRRAPLAVHVVHRPGAPCRHCTRSGVGPQRVERPGAKALRRCGCKQSFSRGVADALLVDER